MIINLDKNNQIHQDERGFASLVVALVMILVLSLITVGFAQLARREQQNTLNKQLSSQAYYAAEAGINDAYNLVKLRGGLYDKEVLYPGTVRSDQCLNTDTTLWNNPPGSPNPGLVKSLIDVNTNTSYSCVMVDLHPRSLTYRGVSPGSYRTVVFSATDLASGGASDVASLDVHWGSDNNHTGFPTGGGFKPSAASVDNWGNSLAVIQISITPLPPNFNRDYLINNTYTAYLYPRNGAADTITYDVTPEGNAPVKNAGCDTSGDTYSQCSATISGIPANSNYSYLIHFKSYYDISNVKLNAKNSSDRLVGTIGGQVIIDSTGKARDVLKRLQVHVPLKVDGPKPDEALEGQSICKRINGLYPGNTAVSPDPPSGYGGNACNYWTP